uniref:T9SS type A sorting domain-containing protein n=1 Tax=candidate division WOR-3 bacterium TaxID=2052148 RepID=A0A7V3VUJ1_UNCW3
MILISGGCGIVYGQTLIPIIPTFDLVGYGNLRPCFAMTYGKYYLRNVWFPDSVQAGVARIYTYHLFHHFGDVFMTLYSQIPGNLTVSHPPTLITGATSFPVSANDSSIIALTVDGEIIGVAMGTGSVVNINIPAQAPGKRMIVTVTKYNYQRYEAIVPVVYSNYPYVTMGKEFINDSGGDGKINPGETVDYGVYGKNIGQGTAQQVYGKLTETSPYVTVSIDSSWYSNIPQNDSVLGNPYYRFVVANNAPNGHQINFTLNFYDVNDTIFTSHRSLTVYAPALTYQGYQVTGGNGNGILDPGENANLVVTIMNEGGATASNIAGILMENSPYITINDANGNFGTLNPGATGSNSSDVFTVTSVGNAPIGTVVPMQLELTSGIYCDTVDFEIMIGRLMPSDTGYYYVYWSGCPYPQYAPVYSWFPIDTTQTAHPGVSLNLQLDQTVVISLPFIFKYYGTNYYVVSICSNGWLAFNPTTSTSHSNLWIPDTTLPNRAVFAFWTFLNPGVPGEPGDVYYYNDTANHRFVVEWFRVQNPTHFPTTYPTFQIILYDPAYYPTPTGDGEIVVQYYEDLEGNYRTIGIENNTGTVGIQYCYNGTYHSLGVPITDHFALKFTTYPPGVGIEEGGLSLEPGKTGMVLAPSLFRNHLVIKFQIPEPGVVSSQYPVASNNGVASSQKSVVSIKIYDATGRLVKSFSPTTDYCVLGTIVWDGKDDSGRRLPAGVYFVRLEAGDFKQVEKAILLR